MKILRETTTKTKKRRVFVEVDSDEELVAFKTGAHYKLGYPAEDVVSSDILADSRRVVWCSVSQTWVLA